LVQLHAGSEQPYIHNINLKGPDGSVIDPASSTVPYSPAQTCGSCHDVDAASHGWHHNAADPQFEKDGRPGEPYLWVNNNTRTQLPLTERDWAKAFKLDPLGISAWDFTIRFGGFTPGGGLGSRFTDQAPEDAKARWNLTGKLQADCLSCHLGDGSYDFNEWNAAIESHNFKWAPSAAVPFARVNGKMTQVPADYDPMMGGFGADNPMPKVNYDTSKFNGKKIRLEITNDIPNESCYQCHSKRPVGPDALPRWHRQEDIHMAQGMRCVDCHANGMDHMITRSYPDDPAIEAEPAKTLSCKGCHLGTDQSKPGRFAAGGRMAAPKPVHAGIPPIHFEEMSCTSCHSGPNPTEPGHTQRVQTSLAHRLGMSSEHRDHRTLPHVVSPLFLDNEAGKLAPHRAVWPSYWGIERPEKSQSAAKASASGQSAGDEAGDGSADGGIEPLPPQKVATALEGVLSDPGHKENWQPLDDKQVKKGLNALEGGDWGEGRLVYVSGGAVYHLGQPDDADEADAGDEATDADSAGDSAGDAESADSGSGDAGGAGGFEELPSFEEGPAAGAGESEPAEAEEDDPRQLVVRQQHPAAEPYTWALAHDVRPAQQSLGAASCKDCHSTEGATDFTMTAAPSWAQVKAQVPTVANKPMHAVRGESPIYLTIWAWLFKGRTAFKVLSIASAVLVGGLLLAYGGAGLRQLLTLFHASRRRQVTEQDEGSGR
jgi:nitrate/TMAO reductase-like tetraheme cytochrome c subunit